MDLAESHRVAGDLAAADRAFASAAARLEALGRGDAETAGTLLNNWALTVRTAGRPLDAERLFRRAVEIASQDGGLEGVSPILLGNLARTLVDLARPAEAEGYAEHALAGARRGGLETATTLALSHLSFIHRELGQLSAAARELDEFEARIADLPADHYMWAVLASDRGLLAEKGGDLAAARAAHDRAVSLADDQVLPALLVRRAALGLAEGRAEAAGADAARALDLVRRDAEPDTPSSRVGLAQLALARARRAQGRSAEAAAAYAAALAHLTPALGPDHPDTREARAGAAAGATAVPAR
jgi:tetratricopeptide (TPR) repeat protein